MQRWVIKVQKRRQYHVTVKEVNAQRSIANAWQWGNGVGSTVIVKIAEIDFQLLFIFPKH